MSYKLEKIPFPRLLCQCHQERLNGTLSIRHDSIRKNIYLEDGAIVYASSDIVGERFGERLRMSGRLSEAEFEMAMAGVKDGYQFGACLLDLGFVKETELTELLREHAEHIIYSLFTWQEGFYSFTEGRVEIKGFRLTIPTADLIFQGIRGMSDLSLIHDWLGDFKRKLVPTRDPFLLFQTVTLRPEEAYAISRLDSPLSLDELLTVSGIPEENLLRTICAFKMAGIIEVADPESPLPLIEHSVAEHFQPSDTATVANVDAAAAAQLCYDVSEMIRTIGQSADHYQVLGLNRRATPEEIKKAFREQAKKFHPDRHSQLAAFDFHIKSDLEQVFIRIQEAYNVLSDELKRRKYDETLKQQGIPIPSTPPGGTPFPRVSSPGLRPPAAPTPKAVTTPTRPVTPIPPKPSAALPPRPVAPPQAVPPPRPVAPPPAVPPPRPMASTPPKPPAPNAPLTPARGVPTLPDAPSAPPVYPAPPKSTPAANHSHLTPSELYMRSIEYLGNNDLDRAMQSIRRAIDLRPKNSEYHAHLARVLLRLPGHNKQAEKEFLLAIDLDPENPELADLYVELADLYQKFGLTHQVEETLRKALVVNPDHIEATRRFQSLPPSPANNAWKRTTGRFQAFVGKVFQKDSGSKKE